MWGRKVKHRPVDRNWSQGFWLLPLSSNHQTNHPPSHSSIFNIKVVLNASFIRCDWNSTQTLWVWFLASVSFLFPLFHLKTSNISLRCSKHLACPIWDWNKCLKCNTQAWPLDLNVLHDQIHFGIRVRGCSISVTTLLAWWQVTRWTVLKWPWLCWEEWAVVKVIIWHSCLCVVND